MKKLLAAIVAVAMILSLTAVASVAETRDVVTFSADEVTAAPGETVEVTVYLNGEYEAHGLTVRVEADTSVLTVESVSNGSIFSNLPMGCMPLVGVTTDGNASIGIMAAQDPFTATGDLATITYRVADDAEPGTYDLHLNVTKFINMPIGGDSTDIEFTTVDGSVTVEGEVVTPEPTEVPVTEVPVTEVPVTEVPVTEVPVTEEPVEPTEEPVEPTEEPVEPTEEPVEPTEEPVETEAPVETEEPQPTPPETGAIALIGAGVAAIAAGAGVVLFRKKED